jgi:hypothetical protein
MFATTKTLSCHEWIFELHFVVYNGSYKQVKTKWIIFILEKVKQGNA